MKKYDPEVAPSASAWLDSDEGERLALVASYHRRKRIDLPNEQVHAAIHVIVENQLAMSEAVVVEALARLQDEGLSRHEALHAIGSVLAKGLFSVLRGEAEDRNAGRNVAQIYFDGLKKLTAEEWKRTG